MAKKHLFISIGSTSAAALTTLIERLIDLGIYKPLDADYEDKFVAIDTDDAPLQKLLTFNQGEAAHTFAVRIVKSGEPEVFSHDFLNKSYRPDWNGDSLKILAAERGVGGRRIKSFATLEWRDSLGAVIDSFFGDVKGQQLLDDYQVILVASSWGGTASGMFQNISDFIASKIYDRCGANHLTPFYTVLSLPNYAVAKANRKERSYQGLENFAYFMCSMQQAGYRGSLPMLKDAQNNELKFIFPEFCDLEYNGKRIKVDVKSGVKRFCGTNSSIPQRAIVVVPTLSGKTTANTVAEQLLLLGYLDILNQYIDSSKTITPDGKFVDARKAWSENPTQDCPALIGFNMVECQYPRDAVIVRTIEKELLERWSHFYSDQKANDLNVAPLVQDFIKKAIGKSANSEEQLNNVLVLLNGEWAGNMERTVALKDAVKSFTTMVENEAYSFPRFDDANELLKKFAEYGTGIKDPIRKKAFEKSVSLADIKEAYIKQLNLWFKKSQIKPASQLEAIDKMITYAVKQYGAMLAGKGFDNKVVKYCNGEAQVRDEFLGIARNVISKALEELQDVMFARAITAQWRLKKDNTETVCNDNCWANAASIMKEVKARICNSDSDDDATGFIKTVYNETLEAALQNDGLVRVTTAHCIKLLRESTEITRCQSCYDELRNAIKMETITEMDRRKIIGTNNTSMITLADSKLSGCCPDFYEDSTTSNMFHFYVKNNGATDITWKDASNFGFSSFVDTKNTGVNMATTISRSQIDTTKAGLGTWFEDNLTYNQNPLYGMWLGSADIGLTFSNVFPRSYAAQDLVDIQTAADQLVHAKDNGQQRQQCLQTLFEKVVMGAVLGIINEKVKDKILNNGQTISVTLSTLSGESVWSKSSDNADDLGLSNNGDGMNIISVSSEFIKCIMDWTRDENGTCRFAKAFDCEQLYSLLWNQERFVLTKIRLAPTREQEKEIIAFCKKLEDCVTVTIA